MKLHIATHFGGEDKGDGGIRRIVEAQRRYLPTMGVQLVDSVDKADVVCTHGADMPNVSVDTPWVLHCHGLYWNECNWPMWSYEANRRVIEAMRQADHVTAPSKWVAYALERGMWLRPTVLYHGIDPELWTIGDTDGYVLWNKTRVDAICDPTALNEMAVKMPQQRFVSTFGKAMANVHVTGRLPFRLAQEHIRHAGVYLATTRETMGIGTLEAMACGVPILGYKWGGQREFIEHKFTGWLVDPGDVDGLVEGCEWLLKHRKTVGTNARQVCLERFTWPKVMEEYVKLYERVMAKPSGPKVSVIMPSYKLAQYLPAAIDSVMKQTSTDWELIIVDDCSPDETPRIAAEYMAKDKRIRYVRNQTNLYLAGALNAGIAEAKGRYILPLDADNMITSETLGVLSDHLDAHRGTHITYGAVQFVKDDGLSPDLSISPTGISTWPPQFQFTEQIAHRNQIPSTCMYRREVAERTGGYRSRWKTAEDAAFWTHATSYGFRAEKCTDMVTLVYRNRHDSMSRVNKEPDWTAWVPWSRNPDLIPFGAPMEFHGKDPKVLSYEPAVVTVIIPVGPGHEKAVIDAVDSVEAQTFRNWHCIVVNDTGKPLKLPHPWAHIINTDRVGAAAARNTAIAACRTPYFVPLDADDILAPSALQTYIENWEEGLGVLYSQWYDDNGDPKIAVYDPPEYDPNYLLQRGCIHAITGMYSKAVWKMVGGFDVTMQNWEDWDYQIALAAGGYCSRKIAQPLWSYRKTLGLRREDAVRNYDRGREEMMAKWGKFFTGKEKLMGCGACAKRTVPKSNQQITPREFKEDGLAWLEYTGNASTYHVVGASSGRKYRFGQDAGHKVNWVLVADVEEMLKRPVFRPAKNPHEKVGCAR